MKVVIVEDMAPAAEYLERMLLSICPDAKIAGRAGSVSDAVRILLETTPDLVFLDVRLSDGESFEIFDEIDPDTAVIFTTAYDEFAIRAFKLNSIDYLLKPIQRDDLQSALDKFFRLKTDRLAPPDLKTLQRIWMGAKSPYKQRFLATVGDRIHSISASDIAWFRAEDNTVFLCTFQNKEFLLAESLSKIEPALDPDRFFRINRKFIVSFDAIERMTGYVKGRVHLVLKPEAGEETIVSVSRSAEFRRWLDR